MEFDTSIMSEVSSPVTSEHSLVSEQNGQTQSGPPTYSEDDRKAWAYRRDEYLRLNNIVRPEGWEKMEKQVFDQHRDYIAAGAILKPKDGHNAKLLGKDNRCMTCIVQNRGWEGTSVVGGRCECCRGMHGGGTAKKRRCIWLDPDNDLFNYPDGHRAAGFKGGNYKKSEKPTKVPKLNTKKSPKAPKNKVPLQVKSEPVPPATLSLGQAGAYALSMTTTTIFHISGIQKKGTRDALQQAAKELVKNNSVDNDALTNLGLLHKSAGALNHFEGPIKTISNRLDGLAAQIELTMVFYYMDAARVGVEKDMVEQLAQDKCLTRSR